MAKPGALLGLDLQDGHNHFNIGIGFTSGHVDTSPADVAAGYESNPQFISVDADAWVRFRIQLDGATTSSGTKYARSELREFDEAGTTKIAFDGTTGTHYIEGTSRITHLPPNKPWVCFFQIHDASSDLCRVQTEGTSTTALKIVARNTPPGSSTETATTIMASYTLGTEIAWRMEIIAGVGKVFLNGTLVRTFPASATGLYFKVGAYAQSNETTDSATEYVAVDIKAGSLKQWHTGWPTPVDYLGGSGGGTTPPVVVNSLISFGACLEAADSNAFARIKTMNPKRHAFLGDTWYKDGTTPTWVADWNAKFGATNCAAMLAALPTQPIVIWSDHDFGYNANAVGTANATVTANANAAYRSKFASVAADLPSGTGIYRTFMDDTVRVRHIVLDERSFKSANAATDNSSKTVLGSVQKAWLKNLLANPGAPVVIIYGDIPWTQATLAGDDGWKGYNTERQELATAFAASPAAIVRLNGDMHCLAWTHDAFGIDRCWQAAGFHRPTKVKDGGTGLGATYPTNGSSLEGTTLELFGTVNIADDGNQLTLTYTGFSAESATSHTQRLADTITVSAPGGSTGGGTTTPPPVTTTVPLGPLATSVASGPITPGFPPTALYGDMLLYEVHSRYGKQVTCNNQDWQLVASRIGTQNAYAGGVFIFAHRLVPGDVPPTFTSETGDGGLIGRCSDWGDVTPESAVTANGNARPVVGPSARSTVPNSKIAYFIAQDNDYALTAPTGGAVAIYANTANGGPDGTDGAAIALAVEVLPNPGDSGTVGWTSTGTGAPDRWVAATVVLKPGSASTEEPPEGAKVAYGIDVDTRHDGLDMAAAKTGGVAFVMATVGTGAGLYIRPDKSRLRLTASVDAAYAGHRTAAAAQSLPFAGVWVIGNGEAPESQAARCKAALVGDLTRALCLVWDEGGGDYPQLAQTVHAFRDAGLHVAMVRAGLRYSVLQNPPFRYLLGPNLGMVSGYPASIGKTGTLQDLYRPIATRPLNYYEGIGGYDISILRYSDTAVVASVPNVGANAFPGDAAALAALFAPATGPDVESPQPLPQMGPQVSGLEVLSEQPVQLVDVQYVFHFQDLRTGQPYGELPLKDVKCGVVLGGEAGPLTATINVSDPAVRALNPWAVAVPRRTALFVRRIEKYPPGTLPTREKVIWSGIVWDLDPVAGSGHLEIHAATFESYFARRYIDEDRRYSNQEQTAIHSDLTTFFQSYREGAGIGVANASKQTGRRRDRIYLASDNSQLLEMLRNLGRVDDGFDWYIEGFRDASTGAYGKRVVTGYPRLGRLATGPTGPLRLRHYANGGPSNIISAPVVKRQGTTVNNEMIGLGAKEGEVQTRVVVTAGDLGRPEIQTGFPLLQGVHSDTSVTVLETLRDNTSAALVQGWTSEILLTQVTLQGTSTPTLHDISLGDDVQLDTDDATWPQPVSLAGRIFAIQMSLAQGDQSEQVELTLAGAGLSA